jgi:hypothetical protein
MVSNAHRFMFGFASFGMCGSVPQLQIPISRTFFVFRRDIEVTLKNRNSW